MLQAFVAVLDFDGSVCAHYDYESAMQSVTGMAACCDKIALAVNGMHVTLRMRGKGPQFHHVTSHVRIPLNELADRIAKEAMRGTLHEQS